MGVKQAVEAWAAQARPLQAASSASQHLSTPSLLTPHAPCTPPPTAATHPRRLVLGAIWLDLVGATLVGRRQAGLVELLPAAARGQGRAGKSGGGLGRPGAEQVRPEGPAAHQPSCTPARKGGSQPPLTPTAHAGGSPALGRRLLLLLLVDRLCRLSRLQAVGLGRVQAQPRQLLLLRRAAWGEVR